MSNINLPHTWQAGRPGRPSLGSWLTMASEAVSEIMARADFDWLVIDMEHSPIELGAAERMIRVINLCGLPALVRVGANDPALIKRVMDAGASGVVVPMVNSAEEASRAVRAVKYPPLGFRGVGLARAQGYGSHFEEYQKWNQEHSTVIIQVEHIDAVNALDDILKVPGVDGYIIGPYDLSGSLDVPGQFDHPSFRQAMQRLREKREQSPVAAGLHVVQPDPAQVREAAGQEYSFLACGVDFLYLSVSCRQLLQKTREGLNDHAR